MEKSRFEAGPPGPGFIELPRHLTRRRFVLGLSGALATSGLTFRRASAHDPAATGSSSPTAVDPGRAILSGTEFNLEVSTLEVNFTGAKRTATAVNGQVPGPLLRWRAGDRKSVV